MKTKITLAIILLFLITFNQFKLIAQNIWQQITPTGDLPAERQGHSMVTIDTLVYMFGGMNNSKPIFNHVTVYDTQQRWSDIDDENETIPPPRYQHKAISSNGKMLVFFGKGTLGTLDDIWQYDPQTNQWQQLVPGSTTNPVARCEHTATLIGNKVWVFGGRDNSNNLLNDLWAYDISTNQWTSYPSLTQTGLAGHVAVHDGTNLYLFLGYDNIFMNTEIYKFDPIAGAWTQVSSEGSMPYPVAYSTCVQVDDLTAYIFGGSTGATSLGNCYKWDISTHTFTQIASGPEVSEGGGALINVPGGAKSAYKEIVFFGGEFEGTIYDDTWVYTTDLDALAGIEDSHVAQLLVYPNPATDHIYINLNDEIVKTASCSYQLFGIMGRKVNAGNISKENQILDISSIPEGVYFLQVFAGKELVNIQKIVKQ
ncbi:MAG TPA: kelch repeat-containing protein [Bacteroidales bacterium]|nr:kelch repeat-containing protein [Bacteroidales bacterium]